MPVCHDRFHHHLVCPCTYIHKRCVNDNVFARTFGPHILISSQQVQKTTELEEKLNKKKTMRKSIDKAPKPPEKKMTQAERLREAVQTERLNAQSLMRFEQKEAAKKKKQLRKTTFSGPVIRCVSMTCACIFMGLRAGGNITVRVW